MHKYSILIIEDEEDLREVLEINLRAEGFHTASFASGEAGLAALSRALPDLVLLDLMLPGIDGQEVCRRIRADARSEALPVIMVTAKGKESDIVLGLGLGADDYITKPFHIAELIARVKAALRRSEPRSRQLSREQLRHGPFVIDRRQHALFVDGVKLDLTATEFRLAQQLFSNPGSVLSREALIDVAIGKDVYVNERTIDTHLSALRRKLGSRRDVIRTVWGVGYCYEPPSEAQSPADGD